MKRESKTSSKSLEAPSDEKTRRTISESGRVMSAGTPRMTIPAESECDEDKVGTAVDAEVLTMENSRERLCLTELISSKCAFFRELISSAVLRA